MIDAVAQTSGRGWVWFEDTLSLRESEYHYSQEHIRWKLDVFDRVKNIIETGEFYMDSMFEGRKIA